MSPTFKRNTSACSRNVVVSDQLRTVTLMICPPREKPSVSIFVNGQGPAMHVILALRNSFPGPASKEADATPGFHFPSGEHGRLLLQATFPVFSTWNVLAPVPITSV